MKGWAAAVLAPVLAVGVLVSTEPAQAVACGTRYAVDAPVIAGRVVHIKVAYIDCANQVFVDRVEVSSPVPAQVRADLWRYRWPSVGAVYVGSRSTARALCLQVVWLDGRMQQQRYGWSGYVVVTVTARGGSVARALKFS